MITYRLALFSAVLFIACKSNKSSILGPYAEVKIVYDNSHLIHDGDVIIDTVKLSDDELIKFNRLISKSELINTRINPKVVYRGFIVLLKEDSNNEILMRVTYTKFSGVIFHFLKKSGYYRNDDLEIFINSKLAY